MFSPTARGWIESIRAQLTLMTGYGHLALEPCEGWDRLCCFRCFPLLIYRRLDQLGKLVKGYKPDQRAKHHEKSTKQAVMQYLRYMRVKDLLVFERFGVLLCVALFWAYAHLLTMSGAYKGSSDLTEVHCPTDQSHLLSSTPWVKFPYPLQWGAPSFNAGHTFGMMAPVLISIIESTAAYLAASRLASATPPPTYVLSRGIGWQGIGILLDGLFGTGTGSTVSVENVGLLGVTRVGSCRVVQISAGFMILFSILEKFGALFASIPFPIFAILYCVLFGLVVAIGLSFLQFTNMNSLQNLFITGVSLFIGLSISQYFNEFDTTQKAKLAISQGLMVSSSKVPYPFHGPVHIGARWFNDFLNTVFTSTPTIALIIAVFLDNTLQVHNVKKDRGLPWWVKF